MPGFGSSKESECALNAAQNKKKMELLEATFPSNKTAPVTSKELACVTNALCELSREIALILDQQFPEESFSLAPASLAPTLGAALQGLSNDKGRSEKFLQILKLHKMSEDRVQAALKSISESLVTKENKFHTFNSANCVIAKPAFTLHDSFKESFKKHYEGEIIQSQDMKTSSLLAKAANKWISEKMQGLINEIVQESSEFDCILSNAVYFKGAWEKPFKKENTFPAPFTFADTTVKYVDMMRQQGCFPYAVHEDFIMIEMPYKAADKELLSQLIFLPHTNKGCSDVLKRISTEMIAYAKKHASEHRDELKVSFPKIEHEYSKDLLPILKNRIGLPLNEGLSDLTPIKTSITSILHKVKLTNDEEGTEAAAATTWQIKAMRPLPKPKDFLVDRPFVYVVMKNGQILFLGAVKDEKTLKKAQGGYLTTVDEFESDSDDGSDMEIEEPVSKKRRFYSASSSWSSDG